MYCRLCIIRWYCARCCASHKWKKKGTKIKHCLRYVTFPSRRLESRQKSPWRRSRVNVRGRRAVHVLCGLPVCAWLYDTYTSRYISECLRIRPEQVHGTASPMSLDISMTREEGRKIFTPRTLYIFNSLALMSLALVAPNRRRRGSRIASEFPILISARYPVIDSQPMLRVSRDKSRATGMNLGLLYWFPKRDNDQVMGHFFGWRRTLFSVHHIFHSFPLSVISRVAAREVRGERREEIASDMSAISSLTDERTCISSSRNIVPGKHRRRFSLPRSRRSLSRCNSDGARFAFALHETLQNSK